MDSVAITLGTVVAKWVFQLWTKDSAFENIGGDLIDVVSRHISGRREQRRVGRQFEALADNVADRLEPYLSNEIQGIDEGEIASAARAVEETLASALISTQKLLELNLDHAVLLAELEKSAGESIKRNGLSDGGKAIFNLLLTESASFAMSIVEDLPGFASAQAAELLTRDTTIIELVNSVLDRMPTAIIPNSWGIGSDDQRFENKYRKAMHSHADKLQIFGVTSDNAQRAYSLSVAYISMAVTSSATENEQSPSSELLPPDSDIDLEADHDPSLLDSRNRSSGEEVLSSESIRVDAALSGQQRLIIGGDAGSGKTTLLQWLAASAANRSFMGDLSEWNELVPFVIPLRRYANRPLPEPQKFLEQTVQPIAGAMPHSWVHRVLADGRGLVLIDGLDEIPTSSREEVKRWLLQLTEIFPLNRFIVTSRTTALTKSWLTLENFSKLQLLPMEFADIRAFISHWHSAAVANLVKEGEASKLREQEQSLVQTIRDRPAIRALCTSPLLCALICALYRDRHGSLPENRMDLYSTALQMLIVRRDTERQIHAENDQPLSYDESQILLRSFALWLHENGLADADREEYEKQITKQLPLLHRVSLQGRDVANHLLIRSGVLREPSPGRVDFVHRTFLEYLAAAALIDDNSIEKLVKHAHDDHWREVIVLAAGHATSNARERLLGGLIARGNENRRYRHRLWLLAISCMETSPELSTSLQKLLKDCLDTVIPPTNMTEARAVASAGTIAVDLLREQKQSAKKTAAIVRTLSLIGGPAALDALTYYGADKRITVAREVVRGWASFDAETYSKEVLADCRLNDGHIRITDPDYLQHIHNLNKLESIEIDAAGRMADLSAVPQDIKFSQLTASYLPELYNLESVRHFSNLKAIHLRNCDKLTSARGIEDLEDLRTLSLRYCSQLTDISAASSLPSLTSLDVSGSSVNDISQTIASGQLRTLRIGGCKNLRSLGDSVECKTLEMGQNEKLGSLDFISASQTLSSLTITSPSPTIHSLVLPPLLTQFRLFQASADPISLTGAPDLQRLYLLGTPSVLILNAIEEWSALEYLVLDLENAPQLIQSVVDLIPSKRLFHVNIRTSRGDEGKLPDIAGYTRMSHPGSTRYWRSKTDN
jgi:hypothetical protein